MKREIAKSIDLNPSTITNIITFLKELDLITEIGKKERKPGRNSIYLFAQKKVLLLVKF